jgi:diaminohydroxyphosphoribosylaminopyrimidine deaminase/5-amino-6-(5-phosphoribosylamino)uracil reductase
MNKNNVLQIDEKYMSRALELARKGEGFVEPNPMVGAVVVKNDTIIAEGFHAKYGEAHAERVALQNCATDTNGATLYVTLEPCSHFGKTPPCTDLLIEKKIAKVVIGSLDPNPKVDGIKILKENGIEVVTGVLGKECNKLNEVFFHYIKTGLPFCVLKYAMTIDGKIATKTGKSKWITGENARTHVHKTRAKYSAIMVGVGTVLADDPLLTCRLNTKNHTNPVRIICDTHLRTPLTSQIVQTAKEVRTIFAVSEIDKTSSFEARKCQLKEMCCEIAEIPEKDGRIDIYALMKRIGQMEISSVLIEGGSELHWSALSAGVVQKVQCYIAPKIFGGTAKSPVSGLGIDNIDGAFKLKELVLTQIDEDFLLEGYIE